MFSIALFGGCFLSRGFFVFVDVDDVVMSAGIVLGLGEDAAPFCFSLWVALQFVGGPICADALFGCPFFGVGCWFFCGQEIAGGKCVVVVVHYLGAGFLACV